MSIIFNYNESLFTDETNAAMFRFEDNILQSCDSTILNTVISKIDPNKETVIEINELKIIAEAESVNEPTNITLAYINLLCPEPKDIFSFFSKPTLIEIFNILSNEYDPTNLNHKPEIIDILREYVT